MEQYNVTGMSCAACSARVEKASCKQGGRASPACSVSLLTNSMGVEGTAPAPAAIIDGRPVEAAGYGASPQGRLPPQSAAPDSRCPRRRTRHPRLKRRLIASAGIFWAVLMYYLHGAHAVGIPGACPGFYAAATMWQWVWYRCCSPLSSWSSTGNSSSAASRACWHRAPNMDTLVALGYRRGFRLQYLRPVFAMTDAQVHGRHGRMCMCYMHEFYFRIRRHDPDPDHRWENAGGPLQGPHDQMRLKGLMNLAPRRPP